MNRLTKRLPRFALVLGAVLCVSANAFAQARTTAQEGLLGRVGESDWASLWLDGLFRGTPFFASTTGGSSPLDSLAAAVREALSVYSLGMLALAGLLLAYHIVSMVVETAQQGVPFGRRTNMFWAPIRFVLAIGLLVPIGGGLNSGQYLVVKLADAGSSLASNAWQGVAGTMKGSLDRFVPPRTPDVSRLTSAALEMELCRSLYRHMYAALLPDSALVKVGNVGDIEKIPAGRLAPETWRYSNHVNAGLPLCGEYRFLSREQGTGALPDDETGTFPAETASFARADGERLMMQLRSLAERTAPAFATLSADTALPPGDVSASLSAIILEQQKAIDAKAKAMASSQSVSFQQALGSSAATGWVTAGFFMANLVRRQAVFGELIAHAIPSAQAPLFGHKAFSPSFAAETIAADPALRYFSAAQLDKVFLLYNRMALAMESVRTWLYGSQIKYGERVLADSLDVRDRIGSVTESGDASFVFARLFGNALAVFGVWNETPSGPVIPESTTAFMQAMALNPFAGMAEMGRRYGAAGHYLLGMTGPGLTEPAVMGSAVLFAAAGFVLKLAGIVLLFAVPLVPLYRFMMGVLAWLLAVLEAVAALPLVALAHLTPSGAGLSGSLARRAYWLWLGVFMRPLLTLFGFLAGLAVFGLAMLFLNGLFFSLARSLSASSDDVFLSVRLGFSLLYAVLAFAAANVSFRGISWFPDNVLRWLNVVGTASGSGDQPRSAAATALVPAAAAGGRDMAVFPAPAAGHASGPVPGSRAAEESVLDPAVAKARAHSMKAALIPAMREHPEPAPVIAAQGETIVAGQTGVAAGSRSAAAAAAGGAAATAVASATACAVAMSRQMPGADKMTPADIEKALDRLTGKTDKRAPSPKEEKERTGKNQEQKTESAEQSSAPAETGKTE